MYCSFGRGCKINTLPGHFNICLVVINVSPSCRIQWLSVGLIFGELIQPTASANQPKWINDAGYRLRSLRVFPLACVPTWSEFILTILKRARFLLSSDAGFNNAFLSLKHEKLYKMFVCRLARESHQAWKMTACN